MADRTISVRLQALIGPYSAAMAKATKDTREFKGALGAAAREGSDFTKQLGTGMLVAGGAVALGFGKMAATGMGFEKQMSGVQAVSGATADQMDRLSEAALKAGASTKLAGVTASDAAAAQAELVKAGVSVDQILGGALMGSLTLASAGSLEFADAATIAAQAMNIFDLAGSDVSHVADVLAAAANKSAGDVSQFGDALRQGGLVAAQTGLSLEETVGALAAFADNALIGSDAGTSLKTMLQRLTPQSKEAQQLMDELGFSAYDASGNFIGLEGLTRELQDSLGGMTTEQRNAALATLFGSDAVRGANVLYSEGADRIAEYVQAVDDQGAAAEMAAKKNDNLAGDIEALGGAIETVMIRGAGQADDALRGLTQTITTMVSGFGSLEGPMGTATMAFSGLFGAAALAGGATLHLAPKIDSAKKALNGMGNMGQFAARNMGKFAGALGIAGIAVAGLTWYLGKQAEKQAEAEEAALGYTDAIREQGNVVGDVTDRLALEGVLEGELGEAVRGAKANLDAFTDTLREAPDELMRLDDAVNTVALQFGGAEALVANLEDALDDAGLTGTAFADELLRLAAAGDLTASQIDDLIGRLAFEAEAHKTGAREAKNQAAATEATGGAAEEAAPKIEDYADANAEAKDPVQELEDAIKGVNDALRAQFDPLFAMTDAMLENRDAQRKVEEAHWKVTAASEELTAAIEREGEESWAARDAAYKLEQAQLDLDDANRDAARSALDVAAAANELKTRLQEGNLTLEEATGRLDEWVRQGLITEGQAEQLKLEMFFAAVAADELGKKAPKVTLSLDASQFWAEYNRASAAMRPSQIQAQLGGTSTAGPQVASGGLITGVGKEPIYRALGGPSGTDVVPAWLTPGEYVVKKSAVDAVGLSFMHALNAGRMAPAPRGSSDLSGLAAALSSRQGGGSGAPLLAIEHFHANDRPSPQAITHELRGVQLANS